MSLKSLSDGSDRNSFWLRGDLVNVVPLLAPATSVNTFLLFLESVIIGQMPCPVNNDNYNLLLRSWGFEDEYRQYWYDPGNCSI